MTHMLKLGGQLAPLIIAYLNPCELYVINRAMPHPQLWGGKYDLKFVLDTDWAAGITPLQEAKVLLMAIQLGRINIVTYLSAFHTPTPELVDCAILNERYSIMHVLHQHMSVKNYRTARRDSVATGILEAYVPKKQSKCIVS